MGRDVVGALGMALALTLAGCGADQDDSGRSNSAPAVVSRMPSAGPWPGVGPPVGLPAGEARSSPTQGDWWSTSPGRDLIPTGFDRVAGGGARDVVVDGSGAIWVHGPWTLARIGPGGTAPEIWDIGDDAAFGRANEVLPAEEAGVWLLVDDRLLRFDGRRFAQEVEVPASVSGNVPVRRVVESGGRLWVGTPSGVWRLSAGRWTRLGPLTGVGALVASDGGGVWAAGRMPAGEGSYVSVVHIDPLGQWEELSGTDAPSYVHDLLAVPSGGVIAQTVRGFVTYSEGRWSRAPGPGVGVARAEDLEAAVGQDGALWVRGDDGVARLPSGGTWQEVPVPSGGRALAGVATLGDALLVVRDASLLRVASDGSVRVLWQDPIPHLEATSRGAGYAWDLWSPGDMVRPDGVTAVSATEVWATALGYPRPFRYQEGRWEEVRTAALGEEPAVVRATDGATWWLTEGGLTRMADGGQTSVLPGITGGRLLAGDSGSVWVLPEWWYGWWYRKTLTSQDELAAPRMVRVAPDESRTSVPLPGEVWTIASAVAGSDGALWLGLCDEGAVDPCPSGTRLMGWDGRRWTPVPHPGQTLTPVGVDEEHGLWAVADGGLARYAQGSWTQVAGVSIPGASAAVRGASLCAAEGADLVGAGADGQVTRRPLPGWREAVAIARDGSVWVVGPGGVAVLVHG